MKTRNTQTSQFTGFAVAAFTFIATVNTANAQLGPGCQQFLQPHIDFLKNQTQGKGIYKLHIVFVAIGWGNQNVRYGKADLTSFPLASGTATIYTNNNADNTAFGTETRTMTFDLITGRITIGGTISTSIACSSVTSTIAIFPNVVENGAYYYWIMNIRDKFEAATSTSSQ